METTLHQEIRHELEKSMFNTYKENYPTIFSFVNECVKKGYTPSQVKTIFEKKFDRDRSDRLQAAQISLVASYLVRCPQDGV